MLNVTDSFFDHIRDKGLYRLRYDPERRLIFGGVVSSINESGHMIEDSTGAKVLLDGEALNHLDGWTLSFLEGQVLLTDPKGLSYVPYNL
jgi:hypothetical protein